MIITKGLTKKYGNILAVDDLNLQIGKGESYGFLGPNGAGKTTTLMMMLGVLKPTSGEILIEGRRIDNSSFDIKKKIGVVVESPVFYEDMTAWEYLMFFGKLYGVENRAVVVDDLSRGFRELLNKLNISNINLLVSDSSAHSFVGIHGFGLTIDKEIVID